MASNTEPRLGRPGTRASVPPSANPAPSVGSSIGLRPTGERRVVIVGGGASGVLLACHLLRNPEVELKVTLIERRPGVGQGIAYSTANPHHVLNVRASNMSAFADDPDHFWRWLVNHRGSEDLRCSDPFCFAPRALYGRYIANLIEPLQERRRVGRLEIVQGECVDLRVSRTGVVATLADGADHLGDIAVLATGHETPTADCASCYAQPWTTPEDAKIAKDEPVLILGTGLTMVDYVLALQHAGHAGPTTAMSRRGLLPHVHRRIPLLRIEAAEVPFGADVATLLRWLRDRVERTEAEGGDWRSVIDAVRPFTQKLWQTLPLTSRRRFLEHLRAWWDVHRHRMAPEIGTHLHKLIARGRLQIVAGKICAVEPSGPRSIVRYRRRGAQATETMRVAKIIECRGVVTNPLDTTNPVLVSLFRQGRLRADPLRIGIDVSDDCAIVAASGEISQRLFAIGPLTRAAFWEIVAVPDIRVQCAQLAQRITTQLLARDPGGLVPSATRASLTILRTTRLRDSPHQGPE